VVVWRAAGLLSEGTWFRCPRPADSGRMAAGSGSAEYPASGDAG
jgi:hypothetical protein